MKSINNRPNPYENALGIVQGASNCLGITKSLAEDMQTLADDMREKGTMSTEKLNQHPVMRLYLEQLVHLCAGVMIPDGKPQTDYFTATRLCEQMKPLWAEQHPRPVRRPFDPDWFRPSDATEPEKFVYAQLCAERRHEFKIEGRLGTRIHEGQSMFGGPRVSFYVFHPDVKDQAERCMGDGVDRYNEIYGMGHNVPIRVGTRNFYLAVMNELDDEATLRETYFPETQEQVLLGDGYADGGAPYTNEELDTMNGGTHGTE